MLGNSVRICRKSRNISAGIFFLKIPRTGEVFCVFSQPFFFFSESKQPLSSPLFSINSLPQTEFLSFLITQAPALFGLVVRVTEVSTFMGTLSFPCGRRSLEFPGEDRPHRIRTCLYVDVSQNGCSPPLPEESVVSYLQSASTQAVLAKSHS